MRFLGSAAVFVLTFVASVPVAEAVFRLLGDTPSYDLQGLYVPFGGGSYRLGASVNTDALWASGRIAVHTDELGLRSDADRRYGAKTGEAADVLLVGDSQGFGNGVNYEDSIAGSLAGIASQDGYRVRNASVGGHSLATQLKLIRWLQEDRRLTASHLVILLTPVMMRSCDQETRATVGADGRLYGDVVNAEVRLRRWLKTHLVLYSRVRDALRNYGVGIEPAKTSPAVFDFYRAGALEIETREKLYSCLTNFAEYSLLRGLTLHVVYLPSVVEADFETLRQAAARQNIVLDPDVPFRIYSTVSERLGLRPLDLRPTLEKVRLEGHLLNVKADFHYSAALSKASSASLWTAMHLPTRQVARSGER